MERSNRFINIYKSCNNGNNKEKYDQIKCGRISLPRYIDVELTNFCNFRCCFCPTGTKSMQRVKGFMSDTVIEALIDNIEKYNIPGVRFIRWGEPTMHPKYIEVIQKIKRIGAAVHINTNGLLLGEAQIKKLIDIGLDSIKFSFQGADEGTYNEMREGGDYNRLLEIVRLMYQLRGDKPYPYIQITTTLTEESIEQINHFKQDIGDYCDYYNIGYTILTHLNVDDMKVDEEEKEKIRQLQQHEKINHIYPEVCQEAFDKLSINWNGDVTLCCADYDNYLVVGNILDMDLKQLFNSNAANQYRDMIVEKQYERIKCCSTCYQTVSWQK
ncbi:MAG: radical SAM protein [Muribaculum sp.]|nr:radical SAM protein [Muribaculum sp.]